MNTPISFEIAKLLKEKGFDENCRYCYVGHYEPHHIKVTELGYLQRNSELIELTYTAPIISDVIVWLYEKYGIWICVEKYWDLGIFCGFEATIDTNDGFINTETYNSPTEAYSAAIEYTLKNLI